MSRNIILLCSVFILASTCLITNSYSADYDYEYVKQSSYVTVEKGKTAELSLTIRNNGTSTWTQSVVKLGTYRPMDRKSGFVSGTGWLAPNRIRMQETSVSPGGTANFKFTISTANIAPGVYDEYFCPVADGVKWMKDVGIYWRITVTEPPKPPSVTPKATFMGETVPDGSQFKLGQQFKKTWTLQNSGSTTWGNYILIHVSGDRLGASSQVTVPYTRPGATAVIEIQMTAPTTPGTYKSDWRLRTKDGQTVLVSNSQTIWAKIIVNSDERSSSVCQVKNPNCSDKWGKVLGEYKGVPVCYNVCNESNRKDFLYFYKTSNYGLRWQCVEYVKRFYAEEMKFNINYKPPSAKAKDYYTTQTGLITHVNGGTEPPRQNDIIVFDKKGDDFGHIAIISNVIGNKVTIVQQNVIDSWTDTCTYNDKTKTVGSCPSLPGYYVLGWMRNPK